jgi:hypothetical protein
MNIQEKPITTTQPRSFDELCAMIKAKGGCVTASKDADNNLHLEETYNFVKLLSKGQKND